MSSKDSYQIHHRVKLPDGRQVEVVYLNPPSTQVGTPTCAVNDAHGEVAPLHICFHCKGKLVHPIDWQVEEEGAWRLLLRCPECEATREGVFEQSEADLLERELDLGIASLLADLRHITHANMSEEVEFFVRALKADIVSPADF